MVAAAPYALAVAVAVMVIVDTMAREEAYKLGEKLSKANRILREKSPKASDVAAFYREQCEKYLGASKNLLGIFATLAGSGASEALSAATAKIPELEVWENKSQSISTEYCQINLYQLAEKEGCKSFDDIQGDRQKFAEAHQTDSKALCYEDKKNDRIVPITASCQLPIATEARKAAFDDAQKKVDEYNATYSFDKTMELLNAKMTMVMSDQSGIIQGIRDLEFEPIDKQQRLTFAKLIKFINILQRSRPLADGEKALVAELAIQKQFTSLRSKYLDLVRDTLDLIFGNKTKKEVLARMKLYNEELKPFYEKYLHIEVVMDLRDDFSALVRDVNGL
jgi:hypothetical protein